MKAQAECTEGLSALRRVQKELRNCPQIVKGSVQTEPHGTGTLLSLVLLHVLSNPD